MSVGTALPVWGQRDLVELLTLERRSELQFRNRFGDPNPRGRAYGGQILGQTLAAAAGTVPPERPFASMQLLFLQRTLPEQPIDFEVAPLQEGKRFSARSVNAVQPGGRAIAQAQVSFAQVTPAPAHAAPLRPASALREDPEQLPSVAELPQAWRDDIAEVLGYPTSTKFVLDFRLPERASNADLGLRAPESRMRMWLRATQVLPADEHLHAAIFSYLTDWWVNYCSIGSYVRQLKGTPGLYVASLNHCIWSHCALRADEWMHFDCISPVADGDRSLAVARVHDRAGRLIASVTQECLMVPRTT